MMIAAGDGNGDGGGGSDDGVGAGASNNRSPYQGGDLPAPTDVKIKS